MGQLHDEDFDDDEDFEGWGNDDGQDTGKNPKFVRVDAAHYTVQELTDMRVDDLVKAYREIRDQLTTDRRGYKAREAAMKVQMSMISMQLRDRGDALGVDNFATTFGTAYRSKKERFGIADWDAFVKWLDATKNFQVLQKRVSPNAVREIAEEARQEIALAKSIDKDESPITDDQIMPPGVSVVREIEFAVRAPTAGRYKR